MRPDRTSETISIASAQKPTRKQTNGVEKRMTDFALAGYNSDGKTPIYRGLLVKQGDTPRNDIYVDARSALRLLSAHSPDSCPARLSPSPRFRNFLGSRRAQRTPPSTENIASGSAAVVFAIGEGGQSIHTSQSRQVSVPWVRRRWQARRATARLVGALSCEDHVIGNIS